MVRLKASAQAGAWRFLSRRLLKIKGLSIKKPLCGRGSASVSAPVPQEPPPPAWTADLSHPNGFVRENILSVSCVLSFFFPSFMNWRRVQVFPCVLEAVNLAIHTHGTRSPSSGITINFTHSVAHIPSLLSTSFISTQKVFCFFSSSRWR